VLQRGGQVFGGGSELEVGSYTRMLWMGLRKKAAYLPG
jgi:hypothetical protein